VGGDELFDARVRAPSRRVTIGSEPRRERVSLSRRCIS
jgi:hypothetical protein